MKKFLALILALVMALSLVACGGGSNDAQGSGDGDATATGSVYYLNFKPEADQAWQDLAAAYTAETGVPVKVVTAASGQYDTTLTAELDKDAAPTMFQVGNVGAVNSYGEFCYNLEGTDVWNQMTTHDFDLKKPTARPCPSVTATRPSASSSTRLCWSRPATPWTRSPTSSP